MAASIAQVADGGRAMAQTLEGVGDSTRRATEELEDIRTAACELAATSRRLQDSVSLS